MKNVDNKVLHPCDQVWRDLTMRIQDKVSVKVHEQVLYQVVDLTINQLADQVKNQAWIQVDKSSIKKMKL
jgi:hypothetical protein